MGELQQKHTDLDAAFGRVGVGGDGPETKTTGELFVESQQYKSMLEGGAWTSNPMQVKVLSNVVGGAALVDPMRVVDIQKQPDRAFRLRDLLRVGSTTQSAIEFVSEKGFASVSTTLTAAATADTTTVLAVVSAAGSFVGQVLTVGVNTAEAEIVTVTAFDIVAKTITISGGGTGGAVANSHAIDAIIDGVLFAPTPETTTKPQARLEFELKTANVRTIATFLPASRQVISDTQQLRSYIDNRLLFGVKLAEEEQLLYGDGTGENLQGIITHPDVQTFLWSSGTIGDTQLDAIRRAMTLARLSEYPVTGIVLNPVDWEDIELLKGSDDHYLWIMVTEGGAQRLWRTPVIETTAIRAGDFLLGAFGLGAQIWDREQSSVRVSESHEDFFTRNLVAILAEERIALTIYRPEAFVFGKFDSPPS